MIADVKNNVGVDVQSSGIADVQTNLSIDAQISGIADVQTNMNTDAQNSAIAKILNNVSSRLQNKWYQPRVAWSFVGLLPLSWLFGRIAQIRYYLYRLGLLKSVKLPVPVIVVGNITVGGTGKTPLVIALAQLLKSQGLQPGIISRGVGGKLQTSPQVIRLNDSPQIVGDEALLLARRTGCPVVICKNRVMAATELLKNFNCNILLSDDGLQHYALQRDIEVVLIDGERGFGNGQLLPAGPLREPVKRLQRADFIIEQTAKNAVKNSELEKILMQLQIYSERVDVPHTYVEFSDTQLLTQNRKPIFLKMHLDGDHLVHMCTDKTAHRVADDNSIHLNNNETCSLAAFDHSIHINKNNDICSLAAFANQTVHAVVAIGNPNRFLNTLRGYGIKIIPHVFPDHYLYKKSDFHFNDNAPVLMTEKDAVKCMQFVDERFWYLPVSAYIDPILKSEILKKLVG